MSAPAPHDAVAIVGAGFTGTLLAINLLRHAGPPAILIERRPQAGRGVAYSTANAGHLLNVRAGNMSALSDDPDHFVRWLGTNGGGDAASFVPRRRYGDYLDGLLRAAVSAAPERLRIVHDAAVDAEVEADGVVVRTAGGQAIRAGTLALAPGNLPPLIPPGLDPERLPPGTFVADPWVTDIAAGIGPDDRVLVLGTGLTMVDVVLLLDARGCAVTALSRRGLTPHAHAPVPPFEPIAERPPPTPPVLLRATRARAGDVGWRAAVDELRPFTQGLWGAMEEGDRRRFLRHLRPWWDVHRHRIAPAVAERLARLRREGRLEIAGGTLLAAEPAGAGVRVTYRPRGASAARTLTVARIVNATGPQGDLARSEEPLLRALVARGLLRPDPLHIGVDVDQSSHAIGAAGAASERLLVLGPMTRGAFWEIVAVPDIRRQVWAVARALAHAQWVGGEGL